MKELLYKKLKKYSLSDVYPFHMPGHKRNPDIAYIPADIDITEIDGFDNLHHAQGILKDAKERCAAYYGAEKSWYLVNGSTCGILIAISAVAKNNGGTLLMARNCHKAAYNAAYLNRMNVKYLYPNVNNSDGMTLSGDISPVHVKEALECDKDIKCVIITSPTYDGIVSDIASIAKICHEYNVPLIVDEAHGAHFTLFNKAIVDIKKEYRNGNNNAEKNNRNNGKCDCFPDEETGFPTSALVHGADVVIQSFHKTLPSLTQTAVMHLKSNLVTSEVLDKYSGIYQTSSPSYVMMAGMDSCIDFMENKGKYYFSKYIINLSTFYNEAKKLKILKVLDNKNCQQFYGRDVSKILIFCNGIKNKNTGRIYDGQWLYQELLCKYHLQMEMAAANYVLALTSIMDSTEGFARLLNALLEIDEYLVKNQTASKVENISIDKPEIVCPLYSVDEYLRREVSIKQSAGMISGEYVYLYPPGCPLIVPGERISSKLICDIQYYKDNNYNIEGLTDIEAEKIQVINKDM